MLTIDRKILFWNMTSYYFDCSSLEREKETHIFAYPHSFIPRREFSKFETLQINLREELEVLLMNMNKSTRREIRRATEEQLEFVCVENPTNKDLLDFQRFYNQFAKDKGTYTCNRFHMKTMKLLRDQKALVLTMIQDQTHQQLCVRVYVVDEEVVMNLYSASHFRMSSSSDFKRLLSQANRYLIWKSMKYFKNRGCSLYDMGGMTRDKNIRQFKLGFGGKVVPVYSGYEGRSFIGHLIVKLRDWKISFAKMRNV